MLQILGEKAFSNNLLPKFPMTCLYDIWYEVSRAYLRLNLYLVVSDFEIGRDFPAGSQLGF